MGKKSSSAAASKRKVGDAFPSDTTNAGATKRARGRPSKAANQSAGPAPSKKRPGKRAQDDQETSEPRRSKRLRGQGPEYLGVGSNSVLKPRAILPLRATRSRARLSKPTAPQSRARQIRPMPAPRSRARVIQPTPAPRPRALCNPIVLIPAPVHAPPIAQPETPTHGADEEPREEVQEAQTQTQAVTADAPTDSAEEHAPAPAQSQTESSPAAHVQLESAAPEVAPASAVPQAQVQATAPARNECQGQRKRPAIIWHAPVCTCIDIDGSGLVEVDCTILADVPVRNPIVIHRPYACNCSTAANPVSDDVKNLDEDENEEEYDDDDDDGDDDDEAPEDGHDDAASSAESSIKQEDDENDAGAPGGEHVEQRDNTGNEADDHGAGDEDAGDSQAAEAEAEDTEAGDSQAAEAGAEDAESGDAESAHQESTDEEDGSEEVQVPPVEVQMEDDVFGSSAPMWPNNVPSFASGTAPLKAMIEKQTKRLIGAQIVNPDDPNGGIIHRPVLLSVRQIEEVLETREENDATHLPGPPGYIDDWEPDTAEEIESGFIEPAPGSEEWKKQELLVLSEEWATMIHAKDPGGKFEAPVAASVEARRAYLAPYGLMWYTSWWERELAGTHGFKKPENLQLAHVSFPDRLALVRAFQRDLALKALASGTREDDPIVLSDGNADTARESEDEGYPAFKDAHRERPKTLRWDQSMDFIVDGHITPEIRQEVANHLERYTLTEQNLVIEAIEEQVREAGEASVTDGQSALLKAINKQVARAGLYVLGQEERTFISEFTQTLDDDSLEDPDEEENAYFEEIGKKVGLAGAVSLTYEQRTQMEIVKQQKREAGEKTLTPAERNLRHGSGYQATSWPSENPLVHFMARRSVREA